MCVHARTHISLREGLVYILWRQQWRMPDAAICACICILTWMHICRVGMELHHAWQRSRMASISRQGAQVCHSRACILTTNCILIKDEEKRMHMVELHPARALHIHICYLDMRTMHAWVFFHPNTKPLGFYNTDICAKSHTHKILCIWSQGCLKKQ